jgi:hypothetical protein
LPLPLWPRSVGVAGIGASVALFKLTKDASDTGSAIFDMQQRTQFSAEFLSILKVEAEQSGASFETAAPKIVKFNNTLVDAANGSKELTADLKVFGIDAKKALLDPEEALVKFIQKFNETPDSIQKSRLEATLFKDKTGELMLVIKAFGTDVEGLKKKLFDMGLVWSQDGIQKADAFGDSLVQLGQQFDRLKNIIAREATPEIIRAMTDLPDWVTKNKAE